MTTGRINQVAAFRERRPEKRRDLTVRARAFLGRHPVPSPLRLERRKGVFAVLRIAAPIIRTAHAKEVAARERNACCESGPKTVSRQTSAERRNEELISVERPSPRLPPAVAHRQLTPGTASTARTKTSSRVAGSGPDLANGLGSKFAHRVAVRASRRAPATPPFL